MKKFICVLALSSIAISFVSCGSSPASDDTHKIIPIHFDDGEPVKADVYFFNKNTDIPYLEISDAVNKLCSDNYSVSYSNNTFTVKYNERNTSFTLTTEGSIAFDDFTKFHCEKVADDGCCIDEFNDENVTNQKIKEKSSYTKGNEYKVDLSKFGFKPVSYEGKYYLPINIIPALIAPDYGTFYYAANNEIYLYGNKHVFSSLPQKTSYSKEFYEYCFNEFSLNTELYFGLKGFSRILRNNSKELKYMPNGVVDALSSYKEKIINSKTLSEFDSNMAGMLNEAMTDGGHTTNYYQSLGNDPTKALPSSAEEEYTDKLQKTGKEKRKNAAKEEGFGYYSTAFDTDEDGKFDVGYVTFDAFESVDHPEKTTHSVQTIFQGKDGANAAFNKNADGYDKTDYDIKDVVIDISLNTGGSVAAEGFVLSWICDGVGQDILKAVNGGAYSTATYKFDVNGDGAYDNKDYLDPNVNVYILMSPVTYSAANSLAYNAMLYNRKEQTKKINFIGIQSGGGACSVTGKCYLPSGYSYRLACTDASIDPIDTSICSENGVKPDTGLELTFDNLFNRSGANGINQLIVSKRK